MRRRSHDAYLTGVLMARTRGVNTPGKLSALSIIEAYVRHNISIGKNGDSIAARKYAPK